MLPIGTSHKLKGKRVYRQMTYGFDVQNEDATLYDEIDDFIQDFKKQMLKTVRENKECQKYIESFSVTSPRRLNFEVHLKITDEAVASEWFEETEKQVDFLVYKTLLAMDVRLNNDSVLTSDLYQFEAELSVRPKAKYVLRTTVSKSW